jgi:predicted 3-demethylubiquinone-9 3-methyltransferase (glyoxalase superfamily)
MGLSFRREAARDMQAANPSAGTPAINERRVIILILRRHDGRRIVDSTAPTTKNRRSGVGSGVGGSSFRQQRRNPNGQKRRSRAQASKQASKQARKEDIPMPKVTPFLWFDNQAEEAAQLYTSLFSNSTIGKVSRYGDAGPGPKGTAMTVEFELDGQRFIALNGGPHFKFTEAVSFSVDCKSQEEVDRFWTKLSEGGEEGRCGWLKDRYGLSWQINPAALGRMLSDPDPKKSKAVMEAMLKMKKIDIAGLEKAYQRASAS